jgi:Bifunctional DNA primase/polymerase, N-terminal
VTTGPGHANPVLTAALRYARADWPVFPCLPGQKVPATRHGLLDATTDPDKITWWWSRSPGRNLAIATGSPGPDVLDVDVRQDGNGFAAYGRLRRAGIIDGASAYVRTPTGGLHAYFTGTEQGNGRLPGHHLDFRSRGGYILAPPSQVGGRPYQVLSHQQQGQARLDWAEVTRLLDPQPQHRPERSADRPADASRLAGWVARLPEGNRNDGLFWAANRALEAGLTDLGELAEAARKTGLEEREIARTLASARRRVDRPFDGELPVGRTPEPARQQREAEPS